MSDNWLYDHLPCAVRFFEAMADDRFQYTDVIELYGPKGCLKLNVAKQLATRTSRDYLVCSWLELKNRTQALINRLRTPQVTGEKRVVILPINCNFMVREHLAGLLTYTDFNQFVVVSEEPLGLSGCRFPMHPLAEDALEVFLKRAAKKCNWRYDKALLSPVMRQTGGNPAALIDLIKSSMFLTTPGAVVKMIENRPDLKAATKLYAVIASSCTHEAVAFAITDAFKSANWAVLAEHIKTMLIEDILCTEALPAGSLQSGAWSVLEDFNPESKARFIASCFRVHNTITKLI